MTPTPHAMQLPRTMSMLTPTPTPRLTPTRARTMTSTPTTSIVAAPASRVGTPLTMSSSVPEGSFVVSFAMSREEEVACADAARSKVRDLITCCAKEAQEWTLVRPKSMSTTSTSTRRKLTKSWSLGSANNQSKAIPSRLRELTTPKVCVWERKAQTTFDQLYEVRSCTRVCARRVQDIAQVFDACATSTNCHRSLMRIVYGKSLADTRTLLERTLSDHETLCVRWTALRRTHAMVNDTDYCLSEYTLVQPPNEQTDQPTKDGDSTKNNNQAIDEDDHQSQSHMDPKRQQDHGLHGVKCMPVAYQVISSMETKHCPLLEQSHRLLRGHCPLSGVLVFEADDSNATNQFDIVFYRSVRIPNDTSSLQRKNVQRQIFRLAKAVGKFTAAMATLDMSEALTQRSLTWVDDEDRKTCALCLQRFMLLRRHRHHCRLCGEVVCNECCGLLDALLPTVGITKLRICMRCQYETIQRQQPPLKKARSSAPLAAKNHPKVAPVESLNGGERTSGNVGVAVKDPRATTRRQSNDGVLASGSTLSSVAFSSSSSSSASSALLQELKKPFPSILADANRRKGLSLRLESPTIPSTIVRCPTTSQSSRNNNNNTNSNNNPSITSLNKAFSFHFRRVGGGGSGRSQDDSRDVLTRSDQRFASVTQPSSCSKIDFGLKKLQINERFRSFTHSNNTGANNQLEPAQADATIDDGDSQTNNNNNNKSHHHKKRSISLARIDRCHDQLLALCTQTHELFNCSFAAVTLFVRHANKSDPLKCFFKASASNKLLHVSSTLRCCEPVLVSKRPLFVLNLALEARHEVTTVDLHHLPIVVGPQRAKFYVGTPLFDSKNRMIGAICAFDARLGHNLDRIKMERLGALVEQHVACMETVWCDSMRSRVRKAVTRIHSDLHLRPVDSKSHKHDESDQEEKQGEDKEEEEQEEDKPPENDPPRLARRRFQVAFQGLSSEIST